MRIFSTFFFLLLMTIACRESDKAKIVGDNFILEELADGIYACIHKFGGKAIGNAGVVDNGEATIIFDTFLSPDAAEELKAKVVDLGLSPIRYVVNSHSHNDHIRGNQVFAEDVKIISTRRTAEAIEEEEPKAIAAERVYAKEQFEFFSERMQEFSGDTLSRAFQVFKMMKPYFEVLAESHQQIQTRLPRTFVEEKMDLSGNEKSVQLIAMGPCHTPGDLVMYLPEDKILFAGDILFNGFHPYLPDGNLDAWKSKLREVQTMDIDRILPGHGEIAGKEMIADLLDYMEDLESLVLGLQGEKIPAAQIEEIAVPEPYRDWWLDNFFTTNLRFIYQLNQEM